MIILQILLALNFSMARDIVIKAEGVSQFDYEKHLEENPSQISYSQHLSQAQAVNKDLKEKLKRAQFHFLEGSLDKSQEIFSEISNQRWVQDWGKDEKKIIIYSMLRLAQINKKNQIKYLLDTLQFDNILPIKEDLFPPPMVAEYKRIKNSIEEKVYPLPQNANLFEKILVNGKLLKKGTSFFKTTPGKKRFSFVSNSHKPVIILDSPESISKKELSPKVLISGTCQSPQINEDFSKIPAYGFFGDNCLLPVRGRMQELLPQTLYGKNMLATTKTPIKRKWKRSTWLWIGASIVGAIATYKVLEAQRQAPSQRVEIRPNSDYMTNASSEQ